MGRTSPAAGLRFDARRELLGSVGAARQRHAVGARRPQSTAASRRRCAPRSRQPTITIGKAIGRCGGRCATPSSTSCTSAASLVTRPRASPSPGTFRGLKDKIPYLQALGITDVELLPVFAFDTQDVPAATAAIGLDNFWGYSPVGFFAPHRGVRRRRRSAARVPRPGEGAACGRHRRDPRRGAEPHRRRRRRRADDRLQRARQRAVLSARSGRPSEAISTSRAAATP